MIQKIKNRLQLNKIKNFPKIEGWLSNAEALGLYNTAKMLPENAVCVEIGSWHGKSTYCIAKGLKSGKLFAIDPFNADAKFDPTNSEIYAKQMGESNLLQAFKQNMQKFDVLSKIVIKQGYSEDFHNEFDKIDFLFIDGDHSIKGCKNDYDLYADKVVKGGFILFHDYDHSRPDLGPTHVIDEIIKPSGKFSAFAQHDSLWIGRKV